LRDEGDGIRIDGVGADDAEGFAGDVGVVRAGLDAADEFAEAGEDNAFSGEGTER